MELGAKRGPGRLEKELEAQTALEQLQNSSKAVLGGDTVNNIPERPASKRQRTEEGNDRPTEAESRPPELSSVDTKPADPVAQSVNWMASLQAKAADEATEAK